MPGSWFSATWKFAFMCWDKIELWPQRSWNTPGPNWRLDVRQGRQGRREGEGHFQDQAIPNKVVATSQLAVWNVRSQLTLKLCQEKIKWDDCIGNTASMYICSGACDVSHVYYVHEIYTWGTPGTPFLVQIQTCFFRVFDGFRVQDWNFTSFPIAELFFTSYVAFKLQSDCCQFAFKLPSSTFKLRKTYVENAIWKRSMESRPGQQVLSNFSIVCFSSSCATYHVYIIIT